MQTTAQDLRYASRQLIKAPGFTLIAVLSLALGIGATTAVFSIIYAALINPYPFKDADRIMRVAVRNQAGVVDLMNLSGPQVREVQSLPIVECVLAMGYRALTLTGREFPENVNAITLIGNAFRDLGVPPLMGRGLLPSIPRKGRSRSR